MARSAATAWVKGSPGGRRHDERGAVGADRVERLAPRLGLHHHAGAAAVGRVVDGAVPVVGPVAQVVHVYVEQAALLRLAGKREAERGEVLGEDRDDVDAHVSAPSSRPGRSSMTIRPPATSTSGTSAVTNGKSTSRSGVRITSRSWAASCSMRSSSPTTLAVGRLDAQADQLVVVELLGVLGQLVRVDRQRELGAARGLGGGAVRRSPRSAPPAGRSGCVSASTVSDASGRSSSVGRPTAKRRSGSSVRGSTETSPRSPCARPIRPTTT